MKDKRRQNDGGGGGEAIQRMDVTRRKLCSSMDSGSNSNGLEFKSWWDTLRGEKLIQYRTGADFHDMHVDTIFEGW